MTYDPLGQRIGKREHDQHGQLISETRFTWDGLRLLQEQRSSVNSQQPRPPLARIDDSGALQSYLDSGHLREVKKGGKCGSP